MAALLALHVEQGEVAVVFEPVPLLLLPRARLVQAQLALGLRFHGGGDGGARRQFGPGRRRAARLTQVDPQQVLWDSPLLHTGDTGSQ